jgi:hypothetical protein
VIKLYNTSYKGLIQGANLSSKVPGKKPISSSVVTAGRTKISFSHFDSRKCLTPVSVANNVLPDPAGPVAIIIL